MKVSQLLDSRRENWRELEKLCLLVSDGKLRRAQPEQVARFASLYRSACADLALADAYQLPPGAVQYLHDLVGRAHNQLYRSQRFNFRQWGRELFQVLPARLCRDRTLWLAMALFWGVFLISLGLAWASPTFTKTVLGEESLAQMEESFSKPIEGRSADDSSVMVGFYINHNTGIGLECFAAGTLLGIGGLFVTVANAIMLGASFGHMITVPERANFFHFVTAHGPFELTAIVFSAAAGMRLGFSLVYTHGRTRRDSLFAAGRQTMPLVGVAMALFAMAGLIEAFLSPSSAPYFAKAAVAIISAALLLFYVVGLGLVPRSTRATG